MFDWYDDINVEENTDNWYKNKAGQWVCVGDEDENGQTNDGRKGKGYLRC